MSLVGRKFNKALKRLDRRWRKNVEDKVPNKFKNIGLKRHTKVEDKPIKGKKIQRHECEGLGHIKAEFPTFLKKHKKWYVNHLV